MLQFVKNQDIFNVGAKYLVNPVNCVGVMGKGLALQFKKKYPAMFNKYKVMCDNNEIRSKNVYFVNEKDCTIILFPTKKHWKDRSLLVDIDEGLECLAAQIDFIVSRTGEASIAIPKIGCGLGGLNWENQVKPLINKYLGKFANDERAKIIVLE